MTDQPPHASHHCRHYSYADGPKCALKISLSAPGAARQCMPHPEFQNPNHTVCHKREEWSDEERDAWEKHASLAIARTMNVMRAMPKETGEGVFTCPNCENEVSWRRSSERSVMIVCATPNCARFMS